MKIEEPKAGDVIRWTRDDSWRGVEVLEYTLEVYRFTLGFFENNHCREAGHFTPLCDSDLWVEGPDSKRGYVPNHGEYISSLVPAFDIIRKDA